jgi:predicted AAA+ superfamily ATPase
MEYIPRYIEEYIIKDLEKKMVFLSGPRQAGKTTLAKQLIIKSKSRLNLSYLNWDYGPDREHIIREQFPSGKGILVLDEIHKYSRWRQIVKGLYDKSVHELKILVTGSGVILKEEGRSNGILSTSLPLLVPKWFTRPVVAILSICTNFFLSDHYS